MLIGFLKRQLELVFAKKRWRIQNSHNQTRINSLFDFSQVTIGNNTYGTINLVSSSKHSKVKIGHFCSIADGVKFIINNEHPMNLVSTYPFKTRLMGSGSESISKGDIIVCDDVWIGLDSKIMSGIRIGQGAVIGAGSIVTKDVPDYAIVAGSPAKIIKYRFPPNIILKLKQIDYSKIDKSFVLKNIEQFYEQVDDSFDFDRLAIRTNNGEF